MKTISNENCGMAMGAAEWNKVQGRVEDNPLVQMVKSSKVTMIELEGGLTVLGERGQRFVMNYIRSRVNTNDGHVKLDIVQDRLKEIFGEGTDLLIRSILHH